MLCASEAVSFRPVDGEGSVLRGGPLEEFFEAVGQSDATSTHPAVHLRRFDAGDPLVWDNRSLWCTAPCTRPAPEPTGSFRVTVHDEYGFCPGIVRQATRDTEIGGHPAAEGDCLPAAAQTAGRDPGAFPEPGRLDVGRKPNHHLGFRYGTHQCFGQRTARLELTVTLETPPRRVPSLRLAAVLEDVPLKTGTPVHGPAEAPVAWDAVLPAGTAG